MRNKHYRFLEKSVWITSGITNFFIFGWYIALVVFLSLFLSDKLVNKHIKI